MGEFSEGGTWARVPVAGVVSERINEIQEADFGGVLTPQSAKAILFLWSRNSVQVLVSRIWDLEWML